MTTLREQETNKLSCQKKVKKMRRFSTLLFGIGLATTIVATFVSYRTIKDSQETSEWVAHTYQVLLACEKSNTAFRAFESQSRARAITGPAMAYDDVDSLSRELHVNVNTIQTLTRDNPDQGPRCTQLQQIVAQKITFHQQVRKVGDSKGAVAVAEIVATGEGAALTNQFNQALNNIKQTEQGLLSQRKDRQNSESTAALWLTIMLGCQTFVLMFIFFYLAERNLKDARDFWDNNQFSQKKS